MSFDETQQRLVREFREWIEQRVAELGLGGEPVRRDGDDGSTQATRWPLAESVWLELAVRPRIPEVRVGVLTDDRWKSEELEQSIQDSGDTMEEFVELAMEEAGVQSTGLHVEHYRDPEKNFYFVTPFEIDSLDRLGDDERRERFLNALQAYAGAFRPFVRDWRE